MQKMSNFLEISPDMRFLIVDETPTFREALSNILRKLGYRNISTLGEGHSALELMRNEQVGFIICEKKLPHVSGIEFLREIRETPEFSRVPFMLMSGDITKDDLLLAAEFGIDGFLKKPFAIKDVSARIFSCVQKCSDSSSLETRFEEARVHYAKGNYKKAIELYQAVQIFAPYSSRVRVALSRCHRGLNETAEAEKLLFEAIQINSMYVHAFHELGLVYLHQDKLDDALKQFEKAIQISPNNPIRYETISDIFIRRQRWEEAEDYLLRAVKLELVYPVLYAQLGKVLFAQKKSDKAAKFFERALAKEPENTSYLNSLGICMKDLGKFGEAVDYYNLALKLRPQDTKILFNKALCYMQMNELERATKTLHQILKVDPTYEKAQKKLDDIEKMASDRGKVANPKAS
jgi:Tfp pilus assembly protein PilF/FixJ family two-component response regulator